MKRYKANMGLFILFPAFVTVLLLVYMTILYGHSYKWMNMVNIAIDGVLLIYYFVNFCFEVSIDSEGINFYTAFKRYRIKKEDLGFVIHTSFLTKVVSKKRNFYIINTSKGRKALEMMFKDIKKGKSE